MVFIHGTAKQLETAQVPRRKALCRISGGERSYDVCEGDQAVLTQLREGYLGTKVSSCGEILASVIKDTGDSHDG